MAAPDIAAERRALLLSIGVGAALAGLGILWGILSGSQMILLDGVYSIIGVGVSWLLLRASALASRKPSRRYPFGRYAVVPMVVGLQGFVLLATIAYAAVEALLVIRAGGSEVSAGAAIVYGVIASVTSLVVWWWLRARAGASDLLVAEATGWRIAALRGAAVFGGFVVLAVLDGSNWSGAAPYVDPVMVLITCVVFLPPPMRMVRGTFLELLEKAPDAPVAQAVGVAVGALTERFRFDAPEVRATKLGPKLYVELVGEVDPDTTVAQQQQVFEELHAELDRLPYEIWLTVELTPRPDQIDDGGDR